MEARSGDREWKERGTKSKMVFLLCESKGCKNYVNVKLPKSEANVEGNRGKKGRVNNQAPKDVILTS